MTNIASSKIHPVLLCGGSGTRLWPLSRKSYPKQFSPLLGEESLFQASAKRLTGPLYTAPMVLTNSEFRFIVTEKLSDIGLEAASILIEPEGRNTAPAVLAAAVHLAQKDPEALMLVAPSDHVIPNTEAFNAAVEVAAASAASGDLVTFGIQPSRPETGYGYLELEASSNTSGKAQKLLRFVEKPDVKTAVQMLAAGNYLWNAGIFLFSVQTIIAAFREHAPQLMQPVEAAVANAEVDLGFTRLDPNVWGKADNISIDYAVMEKATNLSVVPYSGGWSDLGGWDAVWLESEPDENGVATTGTSTALDCKDTLLRSESEDQALVGLGLDNIIAVAMPDAVLVADKSRAQDVKSVVAALKTEGSQQAEQFPRDHRPWGWFESLVVGDRFQVKRIVVHPGAALSLQSHVHRAEHWIVVAGTARVTIGEDVKLVGENQSVYVPLGAVHRMENPGKLPMVLIEVQTGSYLGEDDITRYEDVYSRS